MPFNLGQKTRVILRAKARAKIRVKNRAKMKVLEQMKMVRTPAVLHGMALF